jgi:hypothetical protein
MEPLRKILKSEVTVILSGNIAKELGKPLIIVSLGGAHVPVPKTNRAPPDSAIQSCLALGHFGMSHPGRCKFILQLAHSRGEALGRTIRGV